MKKKLDATMKNGLAKMIKDARHPSVVKWIRTGVHALDLAIGNGIPLGRTIEIFGNEQAGKSLLAWLIAKAFQKAGGIVLLFDIEATAPTEFMQTLGLKTDEIILPSEEINTIEDVRDSLVETVTKIRDIDPEVPILAILDSVAATTSRGEWENEEDMKVKDNPMGRRAEAFSKFFRTHTVWMDKNNVSLCCVNQLRDKIGVMFGRKDESPGGRALKFGASVRIELTRGKKIELNEKHIGLECRVHIQKNKVAVPFRSTILRVMFGQGFDPFSGLIPVLASAERIKEVTGGFEYGEKKYKNADLESVIAEHPELVNEWLI